MAHELSNEKRIQTGLFAKVHKNRGCWVEKREKKNHNQFKFVIILPYICIVVQNLPS